MNNEDLYHGITEIRDDQILEAEQPAVRARRSRRAVWLGAAAAAIVLIIVFGVWILPALRAGKEPEPSGPNIQIMSGPDQTDAQSSPDSDPDKSETPTFPDQDSSAEPYLPGTDEPDPPHPGPNPIPGESLPDPLTPTPPSESDTDPDTSEPHPSGNEPSWDPETEVPFPTLPEPTPEAPPETEPAESRSVTLCSPSYPIMAQFPRDEDHFIDGRWNSESYKKAKKQWEEGQEELHRDGLPAGIDGFLSSTISEILTGAPSENRVYSPLSLYLSLAMVSETTQGEARQELLDLLGVPTQEALREAARGLWRANYCDDGRTASLLANSIWLREDRSYQAQTIDRLAESYYAASFSGIMGDAGYDRAIQDWVNAQTGGLLSDRTQGIRTGVDTSVILLSTVYFQAAWEDTFFAGGSQTRTFHAPDGEESCTFMRQHLREETVYLGRGFTAVGKDLIGSGSVYFLLPDEDTTPEVLLQDPDTLAFLSGTTGRKETEQRVYHVNLSLPRFDVSSQMDLISCLEALNVQTIFGSEADYSPLCGEDSDIFISEIKQAARVQIDENGCTAAAYTKIDFPESSIEPEMIETIDLTFDRPFLFVITNSEGLPLFVGVVNHPGAA